MDHDHENYHDYDRHGFCSVLGDLAVSLGLNPLYLMLPAAVNISFMMMMMMIELYDNDIVDDDDYDIDDFVEYHYDDSYDMFR